MLSGKKISLAVTGGIAAYKAADLCRSLTRMGAEVNVLMTQAAQRFIGAATFAGLTGRPPMTDLFSGGFPHISHGKGADLLLIAPATANIMAKLAAGIADCPVSATALVADCPKLICPAMNERMWLAPPVQRNVGDLLTLGYEVVGPHRGELACGDRGWGRLADLDTIERAVVDRLRLAGQLDGRKILITAGPTREYLDPVRFLSNASSGKTGYAIAAEVARRGGETTLISGPTTLRAPAGSHFISITTAKDLDREVKRRFSEVDAVVMTAAVADHRFAKTFHDKLAKSELPPTLALAANPDILSHLGKTKDRQLLIGFAAQTGELSLHGRRKLVEKNLDAMVCTKVGREIGFGQDSIEAVIIERDKETNLGRVDKNNLAKQVVDKIAVLFG